MMNDYLSDFRYRLELSLCVAEQEDGDCESSPPGHQRMAEAPRLGGLRGELPKVFRRRGFNKF